MFRPNTLFLLGFAAVTSCQHDTSSEGKAAVPNSPAVDARPPIPRTDTLELATKPPGEEAYDAYLKADTLVVVSTDRAVVYPFGRVARAAALTTRYPLFTAKKGVAYAQGDPYPYTLLRFGNSAVKFYDDSEEGATVISGHVVDPQIILANGVRLGSTLPELLRAYSVTVPTEKVRGIRIVTVEFVVDRIIYHYAFRNNRVMGIDFDSYSVIDKSL
ncbi:hypothetical protein ACFQ48_11810 [Hymenobacter caeli]|uniref:Uncharacterized protein n=1 Tax=Hymenobacter caeli TaxID=2735894 RepID=A0ABX2FU41_9BACT|nr:hypothetical protein [Hymenobacter caeli]NRT20001.1 hypothetical protein [Hymenobacter caeli]